MRVPAAPLVFAFVFLVGMTLGLIALASNPGIAYTPDSAEYLAGAEDIVKHGFSVLFNPPTHPEFAMSVLWFSRPPAYPALLALLARLPLVSTEAWNFIVLWSLTMLTVISLYLFLKRKIGGGWVPAVVLPAISLPWATSIMADNAFFLAIGLFLIAFLCFLEEPVWARALLVILMGALSGFTKPVGAFACIIVVFAGLLDRRARPLSAMIASVLVAIVVLWSYRNQTLYGRFLFSQVTDLNMAFFNYPALLAQETGVREWKLRDSLMRDFGREVSERGISSDDRAKTLLLAEKAGSATRYIMAKPFDYAICHMRYLPRALGSPVISLGGKPGPGGFSPFGLINVFARAASFLLAILGIPFWWKKDRVQFAALVAGALWLVLSMGPAGDDRTSLPGLLFVSVLAQGGWLVIKTKLIASGHGNVR
ncbi:MAG: hypothetical protein ABIM59_01950 [candidate division WOR-3 bacterium]